MTEQATSEQTPARSWRWPLIVVGFLLFNVVTQGILISFALSDPGFRLEPDYYRHAVDWDQERAEERHAQAQGWTLAVDVQPAPEGALVVARLSARQDGVERPLDGLTVRVTAFHPAHNDVTVQAVLPAGAEPGVYAARLPLRRAGRWTVRVEVHAGDTQPGAGAALRRELRIDLPGAGS